MAESTAVFLISKPPFNSKVIKDISGVFLLNMNKNQARYFHAHNVQNYSQILLESWDHEIVFFKTVEIQTSGQVSSKLWERIDNMLLLMNPCVWPYSPLHHHPNFTIFMFLIFKHWQVRCEGEGKEGKERKKAKNNFKCLWN